MTPHYRQSFLVALTGHFVLIIAAVVVSVLPGCFRPKLPDISSFPDVDISRLDSTDKWSRKEPRRENVTPPPPAPPTDAHEPAMPADPVPVRPPDRHSQKTPTPPDAERTLPKDRTPPHDPKPVASNTTHTAVGPVPVVVSRLHTTRLLIKPGTGRPTAVRPLTSGELDPLGNINAPLGSSNSVPMDERQRCLLMIKRVLYNAWDRPTLTDAGRQSALLEVRFDLSGRVVGAAIAQSSGSEIMDHSVLLAARSVTRVEGLSAAFLKEYPKLTVEFTVTE